MLRRHEVGEADRLIVLFSRRRGKLGALAKGARKLTSRRAGHIELFTHVDLLLQERPGLDYVDQAETIDAFRPLREDLELTSYGYLVVELADALTSDGQEQTELYELLVDTLGALCGDVDPRTVVQHYTVLLLGIVGYQPQLEHCLVCEEAIEPGSNYFSVFLGGVVCPACGPREPSARPISHDALKLLRNLQRIATPGSVRLAVAPIVGRELGRLLRELVERHTERKLRSPDLIARLEPIE